MGNKREKLGIIIKDIPTIRSSFNTTKSEGLPEFSILSGESFETWRANIKALVSETKQNYLTESILKLADGFNGWNDEKDFEKLAAELKTLYDNFEDYEEKKRNLNVPLGYKFESFCYEMFQQFDLNFKDTRMNNLYDFIIHD